MEKGYIRINGWASNRNSSITIRIVVLKIVDLKINMCGKCSNELDMFLLSVKTYKLKRIDIKKY
jgi:hypothetical protein